MINSALPLGSEATEPQISFLSWVEVTSPELKTWLHTAAS